MSLVPPSAQPSPPEDPGAPLRNFVWMLGGRLFRAGLSITVGAWTARHLGPADYGLLNSALAGVMILMAITGLGLDSLVRQQMVRQADDAGGVIGTCLGLRLAAGVLAYVALACAAATFEPGERAVWLIFGAMLVVHTPLSVDLWFQARLRMRDSTLAQNIAFVLSSAGRVGLILGGAPLEWFALFIILDAPVTALLLFLRYWRSGGGKLTWRPAYARAWLPQCWPLLLTGLATSARVGTNQLLLLWLAAPAEAGHFAAAERVMAFALFVPAALVTALTPGFVTAQTRSSTEGMTSVRHALAQVSVAGWVGTLIVGLGAGLIVRLLYGPDYAGSIPPLQLLAASFLINGLGLVRTEWWVAHGHPHKLLLATLSGAILNLMLALVLIPHWGATGAAGAALVSSIFTHFVTGFLWPETRPFARWQLASLVGSGWRTLFRTGA